MAVPLVLVVFMLPALAAASVSFTPPFTEAHGQIKNATGCRQGSFDVGSGDGVNNDIDVHASACAGGSLNVFGRMGGRWSPQTGDTLEWYVSPATVTGHVTGTLSCTSVNSLASLTASLTKWRLVGSVWNKEEWQDIKTWSCPLAGSIAVDEPIQATKEFTFTSGQNYRVLLEALAHAEATSGAAVADFCTDPGDCPSDPATHGVTVTSITMPNEPPAPFFQGDTYWFLPGLVFPPTAYGKGCDYDMLVVNLVIEVDMRQLGKYNESFDGNSVCLEGFTPYSVAAPGTYYGWANATDNEGGFGSDEGALELQIIPFDLGLKVSGFPDLSTISPTQLGSAVSIDTRITPAGDVRTYRVTSGNQVLMSNWGTVAPEPGDVVTKIEYDRTLQFVWVKVDGVQKWTGGVVPNAQHWWKIRAIGDLGAPAEPTSPSEPVFVPGDSHDDASVSESGSTSG